MPLADQGPTIPSGTPCGEEEASPWQGMGVPRLGRMWAARGLQEF